MWEAIYECRCCHSRFTHKVYKTKEEGMGDVKQFEFHDCGVATLRYGKVWIGGADFIGLAYSEGKDEQNDKAET